MDIYHEIARLKQENQPFVLTTIVKTAGSVPGRVGFKMIVREDGTTVGTVGGGELEQRVIEQALERLHSGESGLKEYLLREDATGPETVGQAEVVPMMCSGKTWIYYEVSKPDPLCTCSGAAMWGRHSPIF
jgi:xanthine dehydrogenase accessory factor